MTINEHKDTCEEDRLGSRRPTRHGGQEEDVHEPPLIDHVHLSETPSTTVNLYSPTAISKGQDWCSDQMVESSNDNDSPKMVSGTFFPSREIHNTIGGTAFMPTDSVESPSGSASQLSSRLEPPKPAPLGSSGIPRNRDRSFSLRRTLLARNLEESSQRNGSTIELHPLQTSARGSSSVQPAGKSRVSKKTGTKITVSSAIQEDEYSSPFIQARAKDAGRGISSLPHYEKWLKRRVDRVGLFAKMRVSYLKARKAILRVQEVPPSKDGRHIDLNASRKENLIDERTGREYIVNTIRSSRYTLWTFLPKQLFAQFSKLANFYFLCVSILQMIPGLSTTGTYTTIVPLMIFISISMAKEAYDDLRRSRLDKAENMNNTSVLHVYSSTAAMVEENNVADATASTLRCWVQTQWKDVHVGDIVKLSRDEAAPADLVLLHAEGHNDSAYIETMALDGETNLKSKRPLAPFVKSCKTLDSIVQFDAHLVVEDPNLNLYKFEGKVAIAGEVLPLTNNEIIYRGSTLRNTTEIVGMAIYTGEECKIRMNATKNPRIKAPALQAVVNKVVVIIVIFVVALAIFNTVAYQIWSETTEQKSWYLINAGVSFFRILISFIIMFNTMIPLSLYVSLEIVKLFQMILMNDINMYDEESDTPMEPRTSTINEELGQVSYIFSDKTGTLTNNSMCFRKMSVAGTAWLHDVDTKRDSAKEATWRKISKGKQPMERKISKSVAVESPRTLDTSFVADESQRSPVARSSSIASFRRPIARLNKAHLERPTTELLQYMQHRPQSQFTRKIRFFLLSMALCHTCLPEVGRNGEIDYQAASPDELAVVRAAKELGYILVDRKASTITIKMDPSGPDGESHFETYHVLDVIEFSSERKRMSIIVRMPNQRICIFCKGADSTIMQLLRLSGLAMGKANEVEQRAIQRKSLEAQQAIRRNSEHRNRKDSIARSSLSIHRPSLGGIARPSMAIKCLQPIRDEIDTLLRDREVDIEVSEVETANLSHSLRPSNRFGGQRSVAPSDIRPSFQRDSSDEQMEEALVEDDGAVFEQCFRHIDNFATEGLRTLLYGYRFVDEEEYKSWKKIFLDASTSLIDRPDMVEKAGALIEKDFELSGAIAIEDKLQKGVPEAIDKLRRAHIKIWMLTGDKRETAINIGRSCHIIKDYSDVRILDHEIGDLNQHIAATTVDINSGTVAHSVLVVDGQTLALIKAEEAVNELFINLAILVDSVICCRASPSQKASLVHAIRKKVKHAITLAIGDGANDIAMIQEAHVGIGITGKEGLQAARISDYSIAQFRFLLRLLLVHGRWNYIRTCKYTLGTFWKEMLFYLTQALYQRYAGYTGTSLYESWSLSMFNTLFTSLPVIFMGIFEKDLAASTLLAFPELYTLGQRNGSFSFGVYLIWVFMASAEAMVIFFLMLGLYGQALFTTDNGLYAMGDLTFTACIVVIGTKIQFLELHNKSITCVVAMVLSIGGWFSWNFILTSIYTNNVVYDVKDGFLDRFGRNALWWLTLVLIVSSFWAFEIAVKILRASWAPSDVDVFQELEKDPVIRARFEEAAAVGAYDSASVGEGGAEVAQPQGKRTEEEDARREGEVQELLDRPRVMDGESAEGGGGLRRRQSGNSANGDDELVGLEGPAGNGKGALRRSIDLQDLLARAFGSVRGSLER